MKAKNGDGLIFNITLGRQYANWVEVNVILNSDNKFDKDRLSDMFPCYFNESIEDCLETNGFTIIY